MFSLFSYKMNEADALPVILLIPQRYEERIVRKHRNVRLTE